jgi:hypothetical protein
MLRRLVAGLEAKLVKYGWPPGTSPGRPGYVKGKSIGALFSRKERDLFNAAVEGKRPLSDLPPDLRQRAADFLRDVPVGGTPRAIREGTLYNEARVRFLEGRGPPPGTRPKFIKGLEQGGK